MPVDQKRSRVAFEKLQRQLTKLENKPAPESVHKVRTYGRRVEALLDELVANPDRNVKAVLKGLSRLRKKAGHVRDLDVEINSLRNLRVPEYRGQKAQLMDALTDERAQREKKLLKTFDKTTVRELRKRLKRVVNGMEIREGTDPVAIALQQLAPLSKDHAALSEKTLHQYRVAGKRARYLAELAGKDPGAEKLVEQLKQLQDVLGDWHDWLKLTQRAEKLFGGVQDSALVAALRNVTRAKFRQGVDALAQSRATLAEKKLAVVDPGRKPTSPQSKARAAVA